MKHQLNQDVSRSDIKNAIDEWIVGKNSARDRKIMRLRLIGGMTFERIAEECDMSTRGVVNIVYKCLDRLSKHI